MQRTADFHDAITNAGLPQAAGVVDDAAALDAAVDLLKAHAAARDAPIRRLLRRCEVPASRLPGRQDDRHPVQRERQEPEILEHAAARRQGIRAGLGNPRIMGTAGIGLTQKEDRERGVDQQDVFYRVACFLAAITARLLSRILGALQAPFGAIVANRGEASAGAAAWASATPMRWARSVKERVGASPSARSVAGSTTNRTCIH
jgi:hypothetical protein